MKTPLPFVATLCVCSLLAGPRPAQARDSARFVAWAERYAAASEPTRSALEPQGEGLARSRRKELARLIERDPERALAQALPVRLARPLPPRISALLEERIDAQASLEVLALCNATPGGPSRIERTVRLGERSFRVHAYGRSLSLHTREELPVHGIAIDGVLALLDSRVRRLEEGERPASGKRIIEGPGELLLDAGDLVFHGDEALERSLELRLDRAARMPGPGPRPSPWTVGSKKALYVRVDFSDAPGDPVTQTQAQAAMAEVNTFLKANSYNQLSIATTITQTLRLPKTKAAYESSNGYSQLMADARAAASAAGFSGSAYHFDLIAFRGIASWSWAGLGTVGGKGLWLNGSFGWGVASHELGHNLGLSHSNFWQAPGETIIGAGTSAEYGNPFDVMGSGDGHFNAWDKFELDWISGGGVGVASSSNSFRIYDLESMTSGGLHALKVPISGAKDYWVEFRPGGGAALANAACINWGYPSPGAANLLDMTPWTPSAGDSPLAIGRTFADVGSNLYITPTGKAGTSPEALDVTVQVGFLATNAPPAVTLAATPPQAAKGQAVVFTATASDPNGDLLAYFWDFGDGSTSTNQANQTRSWSSEREVLARVTVSDMKGGSATASALVRVGNPGTLRISGTVLENGNGVENVRVVSGTRFTFTDSAGGYSLIGLSPGNFPVSAVKAGWTLTPSGFSNPVQLSSTNVGNINFTGSRATYSIAGKITSGGVALPGVTVSAGTYSAVTNGNGDYLIGGVPNGTYALLALLSGRTFKEQGFVNPVQVAGANLLGKNFSELVFDLSGEVTGAPGPHAVTDGVRTATSALSGGQWRYSLAKVPPGNWNLVATAPGLTLTPSFANPVAVTSTALTGMDFVASPGTSWVVSGHLQEGGRPLSGVVVDGGTAVSTSDTLGNFALSGVVDGQYTLTPYLSGYQFAPASRTVTVAGADSMGNDFGVLNANSPPTVLIPARASANPVTGTAVNLEVLGDDDDGEANLGYTWKTLFATAPVSYQRNASNAAKSTGVTFAKSGAYSFEVSLADLGNLKVQSAVTVLVLATPTAVQVNPAAAQIEVGADRQFIAILVDQFDEPIESGELPEWSVDGGGTITASGRFTATSAGGPYTVSVSLGGKSGTAQVTVALGPVPRVVQQAVAEPNPVAGDLSQVTVLGDDDEGEGKLTYHWSAVNPPAAVTFSPNNTNAAKTSLASFAKEGSYNLKVELKDEQGLSASSFVTVVVGRGLTKLIVFSTPSTVSPGGTLQFGYRAQDQLDVDVVPLPAATWSVSGLGSIDAHGLFSAGEAEGPFTVTARVGLKTASAQARVQTLAEPSPEPPKKGCGCTGSGEGAAPPFALAALLALFGRLRAKRSGRASTKGRARSASALCASWLVLFLGGCTQSLLASGPASVSDGGSSGLAAVQQPLGEVVAGYPNDQERMLHVLTNQARHSASTPNGNECGDWSVEQGNTVKKYPLVWDHQAGVAARFTSKHLSELGCFQHESCCVLGDAGAGSIQCLSPGACTGSGCNKTCDAGPGSTPTDRFKLLGFSSFSGESVGGNQNSAYEAWCAWMQAEGDRKQNIYGPHTQFGGGAYRAPGTSCSGGYWTAAFGNASVSAIPKIPAASAMYAPPNPADTSAVYFAANYFDRGGKAPKRAVVVVNGHCFDLDRSWGFDDNGTYEAHFPDPDVLPEGCHPYYFLFLDGDAGRHVYPDVGSLQLPLGVNSSCPLAYDPSPQLPADCESGVQQCPQGGQQACYTADPASLKHGECRQGWQVCRNGFWSACKDMIGPFPEACDGLDNNCEGRTDEGNPGGGAGCQVPLERGECKAGTAQCISGRHTCIAIKAPQTELCDGKDNDCDGVVDDGFPVLTCGKGECFRVAPGCKEGAQGVCVPGLPSAEVADFKDNDCDGIVDNGIDCRRPDGGPGYPRQCYSFALRTPDGGTVMPSLPCKEGTQICQADGGWGPCGGEVGPTPEVCDGEDNDCDTEVDENSEIGWDRCGTGECITFTELCQGGTPVSCAAKSARPEVCNGVDDNCDGTADEGCACRVGDSHGCYSGPVMTRDAGVCHPGARVCIDGGFTRCQAEVIPGEEWCDGLDNDCNGVVDNACTPIPPDAGSGQDAGSGGEPEVIGPADAGAEPPTQAGCGCTGAPGAGWIAALVALAAIARRRRG